MTGAVYSAEHQPGNVRIERRFGQPNKHTFLIHPIKQLLTEEVTPGVWLNPFAGFSRLDMLGVRLLTNDINPATPADDHLDALAWLQKQPDAGADGALYDPPYSLRQVGEVYSGHGVAAFATGMDYWARCRDELARAVKPGGKVISFGWTSTGLGVQRGFTVSRVLLVPHGGARNDTICTVERLGVSDE